MLDNEVLLLDLVLDSEFVGLDLWLDLEFVSLDLGLNPGVSPVQCLSSVALCLPFWYVSGFGFLLSLLI